MRSRRRALPGQDRRRRQERGRHSATWGECCRKGEGLSICPGEPGTWGVSAQNLENVANQTGAEREGHTRTGSPLASGLVKPRFGWMHPHGLQAGASEVYDAVQPHLRLASE